MWAIRDGELPPDVDALVSAESGEFQIVVIKSDADSDVIAHVKARRKH